MKKIFQKVKVLLKAEYNFKKPLEKTTLIFDYKGATAPHYKYFSDNSCSILYILGEKINLYVVLSILIKFKIPRLSEYIKEYIKFVKPKYIFHNTYNKRFFEINKKDFNFEIIKIFTQDEKKNHLSFYEFIENKKNLNCDYLFVENEAMKKHMEKYVTGNYIVNGLFQNNYAPKINLDKLQNKLIFISQYRTFKKKTKNETVNTVSKRLWGMNYSYKEFYEADAMVAKNLKDYCKKNNIEFQIAGTSSYDKEGEKLFFEKALGKNNWKYLERTPNKKGYYLTSNAKYIATVDSTLGYECFSRGQRVCFFSIRSKYLKTKYSVFGWPHLIPEEGECWTLNNKEKDFTRLMNFLFESDETEWQKLRNKTLKDIFFYDYENSNYKSFLKRLGLY